MLAAIKGEWKWGGWVVVRQRGLLMQGIMQHCNEMQPALQDAGMGMMASCNQCYVMLGWYRDEQQSAQRHATMNSVGCLG